MRTHTKLAVAALALAAACGGKEKAASDSAAATASPDSAGLQTTPPQPGGPMNMVDSASKAPAAADSAPHDSAHAPGKAP